MRDGYNPRGDGQLQGNGGQPRQDHSTYWKVPFFLSSYANPGVRGRVRVMTRHSSIHAEAFRSRFASSPVRNPHPDATSLENSLLTAYMGFIRDPELPVERFVNHGGWLLEQSRISVPLPQRLLEKALRTAPVHPHLAGQLNLLAAFLGDPPEDAPGTTLREAAFAGYFVLNAPGALLADHAAVLESTLRVHARVFKRFCRSRQLPWDPTAPQQAA